MQLRDYQSNALESILKYYQGKAQGIGNALVSAPTGSGKSVIIAALLSECLLRWRNLRFLILTHDRKIIQQNADKIQRFMPKVPIGIYCAGLGSKEVGDKITMGSIQSIYNKHEELGKFNLIIVDEAHRIPTRKESRYRTFFDGMPDTPILGFTATPFRGQGIPITKPSGIFDDVIYDIEMKTLIDQGHLVPLVTKSSGRAIDLSDIKISKGEYVESQVEKKFIESNMTNIIFSELKEYAPDRKAILFFCAGVLHAEILATQLCKLGMKVKCITGETDTLFRDMYLEQFARGELDGLTSVGVLKEGYDEPRVDCMVYLFSTLSPGRYVQLCGRGMRPEQGKQNCVLLDYGGNCLRHGFVDDIQLKKNVVKTDPSTGLVTVTTALTSAPVKACSNCRTLARVEETICAACGHHFPIIDVAGDLDKESYQGELHKGKEVKLEFGVRYVSYARHRSKKAEKPDSMKVYYYLYGSPGTIMEWVCPQHSGYARERFIRWWGVRAKTKGKVPNTVEECLFRTNELKSPTAIRAKKKGEFWDIKSVQFPTKEEETDQEEKKKKFDEVWGKENLGI